MIYPKWRVFEGPILATLDGNDHTVSNIRSWGGAENRLFCFLTPQISPCFASVIRSKGASDLFARFGGHIRC